MTEVIYPQKFRDRVKRLLGMRTVSEPEITLDVQQLLTLFNHSSTYSELKTYKKDSDMIECVSSNDTDGRLKSLTFRIFNKEERDKYRKE